MRVKMRDNKVVCELCNSSTRTPIYEGIFLCPTCYTAVFLEAVVIDMAEKRKLNEKKKELLRKRIASWAIYTAPGYHNGYTNVAHMFLNLARDIKLEETLDNLSR